jgi:CheY-like chemotaxis protein
MPLAFVVDDDDSERAASEALLRALGFDVESFGDGDFAMHRLAREPLPELILLDVVLPATNGFVVRRAIQDDERTRAIPVIFATATVDVSKAYERALLGSAVLRKPLALEALREAILASGARGASGGTDPLR